MNNVEVGGDALVTLIPLSALYAVGAVMLFRKLTDRAAIRRSVKLVVAHLMELALFLDSPALVLQAHRDLLRENARLLRLIIVPVISLGLAFALAYSALDQHYGQAPPPIGKSYVVTLRLKNASMPSVRLEAPPGMIVETPGVRVLRNHEISWRVRPILPVPGEIQFNLDNRIVSAKALRLDDPAIRSIEIPYPKARILGFSWLAWFSMISALSVGVFQLVWKR